MEVKKLEIGDIVRHTSSNGVIEQMTLNEIEVVKFKGQTKEDPGYVCSFFSPKTQSLEYRTFKRHEIEFVKRLNEI